MKPALAIALLLLANGCSVLAMRDHHATRPDGSVTCTVDPWPPIFDTAAAVTVAALAISVIAEPVQCSTRNTNCESSKLGFGAPMSGIAVAYSLAAFHGFRRVARCR